jgi:prepilin-type N-terminal cleavage/methylation domain-containing protein
MRRAGGFTLLETLVALAVLGTVLSAIFGVYSSSLRGLSRSDDRLTLALFAESLLERSLLGSATGLDGQSGELPDGLSWQVTREPFPGERLREGLTVEEPPVQRSFEELELPGSDGQTAPSDGVTIDDERSTAGRAKPASGGLSTDEAGTATRAGQAGQPVRLRAWLVTVEVANRRGQRVALRRLALERERPS